jgi:hypothetical protein
METCPKCNHDILIYDLRTKSARCLSAECKYTERMDYRQYSKLFIGEEKTLAHELPFLRSHIITAT